jgi:CheY-like chemotaxis protein
MLMNLCVNARDAIVQSFERESKVALDRSGGVICIETNNLELDSQTVLKHLNAEPGEYIRIRVSDNGIGMEDEMMERLFEPFFTTKGQASGTGLGLSVVYGIVQKHGGFIDVSSSVDVGSSFEIYLPIFEGDRLPSEAEKPQPCLVSGRGTILLIEDEAQVRELTVNTLRNCGYTLLVSKDGLGGVDLYRCNRRYIDLVILDVILPGMGGVECFHALKRLNPAVKVLVFTGYPTEGFTRELMHSGAAEVIEKPFKLDHFTDTVSRLIAQ